MKTHLTNHADLAACAVTIIQSVADLDAFSAIAVAEIAADLLKREAFLRTCEPPPQSTQDSR